MRGVNAGKKVVMLRRDIRIIDSNLWRRLLVAV